MKMELTAALLHSPDVLFLDEPTIGLDVIAQRNIQQFLKQYQQRRETTILLTSHYMKDVAALCKRVVIIAQGQIRYDGSLVGIVDQFSSQKIVSLLFASETMPRDLDKFGIVVNLDPPKAQLRVERVEVPRVLSALLDQYVIEDVGVEDPPLEEVIAAMFSQVAAEQAVT
jgi:ABC-2 type transport system ATP-binding protein